MLKPKKRVRQPKIDALNNGEFSFRAHGGSERASPRSPNLNRTVPGQGRKGSRSKDIHARLADNPLTDPHMKKPQKFVTLKH